MILRVKKVLVGDSDFAFVHAIGSDGAEFKMELPVSLGRALKRDALIQVDVTPVSVPDQLDAMNAVDAANKSSAEQSALSSTTAAFGQRSDARTSGINRSAQSTHERAVSSSAAGTLGKRAVSSAGTGTLNKQAPRRRMTSPDPRGAKTGKPDPLRRLLGL